MPQTLAQRYADIERRYERKPHQQPSSSHISTKMLFEQNLNTNRTRGRSLDAVRYRQKAPSMQTLTTTAPSLFSWAWDGERAPSAMAPTAAAQKATHLWNPEDQPSEQEENMELLANPVRT